MSDILSDAAFTNVEITKNIIFKDDVLVDGNRNVFANVITCNLLKYTNLEHTEGTTTTRGATTGFGNFTFTQFQQEQGGFENPKTIEPTLGGHLNEASGEHSVAIGGQYNESTGSDSITLGGRENQAIGDSSIALGVASIASHDNTLVWNSDADTPVESTGTGQCVIGCENGMFFKLPKSRDIKTHIVPEGFACWCWDDTINSLCLKTKQNNILYKTNMRTLEHEIQVKINPETGSAILVNPDDE